MISDSAFLNSVVNLLFYFFSCHFVMFQSNNIVWCVTAASVMNILCPMFVIASAFVCIEEFTFFLNFTSLVAFVHHWYVKSSRRKSLHELSMLKCTAMRMLR